MARYSWKGSLRLSLVTIPVQAFNAVAPEGSHIRFHQLHASDHSRIRHVKVCPVHGEVSPDEVVSGYEYAKGQYVIIDPDELDSLRTESDRAIHLDTFLSADAIDPLYLTGQNYYLTPDGAAGAKPYVVLQKAMAAQDKCAVGQGVMFGREQLVAIRPYKDLLLMSVLQYGGAIRDPADYEIGEARVSATEMKLAETLIKASTSKRLDLSTYKDTYSDKLKELIDAKVEGREIVVPPEEEEPATLNLMDALKKSVAKSGKRAARTTAKSKLAAGRKKSTAHARGKRVARRA
jgi:DNA end-binding protein Ku